MSRHTPLRTALVICDMQEGHRNTVHQFPSILATTLRMIRLAELFGLDIFLTVNHPSIYGLLVQEIDSQLERCRRGGLFVAIKLKNDLFGYSKELQDALEKRRIKRPIVCGAEFHIGIKAQIIQMKWSSWTMVVILDGISSSNKEEIPIAMDSIKTNISGGSISVEFTTSESLAFTLIDEGHGLQIKERFIALMNEEKPGIATGLRGLFGRSDQRSTTGDSEVIN